MISSFKTQSGVPLPFPVVTKLRNKEDGSATLQINMKVNVQKCMNWNNKENGTQLNIANIWQLVF